MIPARDFVNYVFNCVGGGYVYGSSGQLCSLKFRQQCAQANPSQKTNILGTCEKWDGKHVWDCSGIMRGAWRELLYYRSGYTTSIYHQWCARKGPVETMPNQAGTFVLRGAEDRFLHIGTYVGNGMVVDARGSKEGVLLKPFDSYPWTHWAQADEIDFTNSAAGVDEQPALWVGIVKTKTGNGISLWTSNAKTLKVKAVPEGASVDVLGEPDEKGFAKCRYLEKIAFADLQYILPGDGEAPEKETSLARVVQVSIGLNLRTEPVKANNTILLLPPDALVEVFDTRGTFSKIRYESVVGWATTSYLLNIESGVA